MEVQIQSTWKEALKSEFGEPYFREIVQFLKFEKQAGKIIYPAGANIFNAFNTTSFEEVKVVLLGQDPYHGKNQAHGLSFSVQKGVNPPPSLMNIYKELNSDLGVRIPAHGDLTHWAEQGVLLLNACLTVRAGEPASHARVGWQQFTDAVIRTVSDLKEHVVFLLWGKFAQEKQVLINEKKHLVLKAAHPSPYSADKGFFGCKHFSKTNEYLLRNGIEPIDWYIS